MDHVTEILMAGLAALGAILLPAARAALRAAAQAAAEQAMLTVQERLSGGAGRIAGEVVARVRAEGLEAVPPAMIDAAADALKARYAETVARANIAPDTLAGMVAGELGKLGMAVRR